MMIQDDEVLPQKPSIENKEDDLMNEDESTEFVVKNTNINPWDEKKTEMKNGLNSLPGQTIKKRTSEGPRDSSPSRSLGHTTFDVNEKSGAMVSEKIETMSQESQEEKNNRIHTTTNNGKYKTSTFEDDYQNKITDAQMQENYGGAQGDNTLKEARFISSKQRMELDLENENEFNKLNSKQKNMESKIDNLCDKLSDWCNKMNQRMDSFSEKVGNIDKIDEKIDKIENKIQSYEEGEEKGREVLEKRLQQIENVQKDLLQPAVFIQKNGHMFRRILSNPDNQWKREIPVGKSTMYDLDTIEKMQERLNIKQAKYQQVRADLGIGNHSQQQNMRSDQQNTNQSSDDQKQDLNRNQNPNQRQDQQSNGRTQRNHRNQQRSKRLPGTRSINFNRIKKQMGYDVWNRKNQVEKRKIIDDYVNAYDQKLWFIDRNGKIKKRNSDHGEGEDLEKIRKESRNLPGTRLINWFRYVKQFTRNQWLNMTEEQKKMKKIILYKCLIKEIGQLIKIIGFI